MKQTHTRFSVRWALGGLLILLALLTGCQSTEAVPTTGTGALPTTAPVDTIVRATGILVPIQEATLSFATGGPVVELPVARGDFVHQGDLIARLDTALLDADIAAAEAALALAQANLELAQAGAREAQIDELESGASGATAAAAITDAQRDALQSGPTEAQMAAAQAAVQNALIEMEDSRSTYDWVRRVETHPEEYTTIQQQQLPDQIDDYRQEYENSVLAYEAAKAHLEILLNGANADQIAAASAQVWAATADSQALQAQLDFVLSQPQSEDVAILEAGVVAAQAALDAAYAARANAELRAPFDGVISALYVHEAQYVTTGMPISIIGDLSDLQVETTDLSEADISSLAEGSPVLVTFDALPGTTVEGHISQIAPAAEPGLSVNFTVTIELAEVPEGLRWGMTAFVEFTSP